MKNILAGLLLIAFTTNANAAFIDNGNYTTDTVSGLDWLDLTETMNQSYNNVSSQFGTGGLYQGWAYATGLQFNALLSNWSGKTVTSLTNYTYYSEGSDSIDGLVQLLGNTYYPNTTNDPLKENYSFGSIADTYINNSNYKYLALIYDYAEQTSYNDFSRAHDGSQSSSSSARYLGSYLVRQTSWVASPPPSVPEAPSLYLLAFGLLGLWAAAKRKV